MGAYLEAFSTAAGGLTVAGVKRIHFIPNTNKPVNTAKVIKRLKV
jgi:hypothetical protein